LITPNAPVKTALEEFVLVLDLEDLALLSLLLAVTALLVLPLASLEHANLDLK